MKNIKNINFIDLFKILFILMNDGTICCRYYNDDGYHELCKLNSTSNIYDLDYALQESDIDEWVVSLYDNNLKTMQFLTIEEYCKIKGILK